METLINFLLGLPPYIYIPILSLLGIAVILRIIKTDFYNSKERDETFWEYMTGTFWRLKRKKDKKNIKKDFDDIERENRKNELLSNDFFVSCNKYISVDIPSLDFGDEKRNEVLKRLFTIFIETFKESAKNTIKNTDFDRLSNDDIMLKFDESIFMFDSKLRKNLIDYLGEKLYDLLYDSPNGFREQVKPARVFMMDAINTFPCQKSKKIKDNYEKVENVLSAMDSSLHVAFIIYEKAFRSFNGKLTELLKYR